MTGTAAPRASLSIGIIIQIWLAHREVNGIILFPVSAVIYISPCSQKKTNKYLFWIKMMWRANRPTLCFLLFSSVSCRPGHCSKPTVGAAFRRDWILGNRALSERQHGGGVCTLRLHASAAGVPRTGSQQRYSSWTKIKSQNFARKRKQKNLQVETFFHGTFFPEAFSRFIMLQCLSFKPPLRQGSVSLSPLSAHSFCRFTRRLWEWWPGSAQLRPTVLV